MKVVVAVDSFKGSVDAGDVALAISDAMREVLPGSEIVAVPIADGGEGTATVLASMAGEGCKWVECETVDPLMRPMRASYAILGNGMAVIELAAASGLPLVEPELRNPLHTTTFGTGLLIKDAIERGCRQLVVGLGGSATNDGGMGLLAALGFRFVDEAGRELQPTGDSLPRVAMIDVSAIDSRVRDCRFTAVCDVANPLVGANGAAHIFAPQKGADREMVEYLDCGLSAYAHVVERESHVNIANMPRAGAAGGVGGGMAALLGAELKPGSEVVLDMAGFDAMVADADFVITGEGKIDEQSSMGKAVGAVIGRATKAGVPVIGLAGVIDDTADESRFAALFSIQQAPVSSDVAMQPDVALRNLRFTARQVAKLIKVTCAQS